MSFFEQLCAGSKFHKVRRFDGGAEVTPADESPECELAFAGLVDDIYAHASAEGYEVTHAHRTSRLWSATAWASHSTLPT